MVLNLHNNKGTNTEITVIGRVIKNCIDAYAGLKCLNIGLISAAHPDCRDEYLCL